MRDMRPRHDGRVIAAEVTTTLDASYGRTQGAAGQDANHGHSTLVAFFGNRQSGPIEAATTLTAHGGASGRMDFESETFLVAHSLRGEGHDASEDGSGRGTPIIAIQERAVSENPDAGPDGVGCSTEGAAYTLEARTQVQAVAFAENQNGEVALSDVASQLNTGGGKPGQGYAAVAFGWQNSAAQSASVSKHVSPTLDKSKTPAVATPWAVRRLTPRECERLQGFPDDFTRIPWRGKPADLCPDGPRYKALGNSWAVNVAEWVGERIAEVDSWGDAA